jgi:hypothetical protein
LAVDTEFLAHGTRPKIGPGAYIIRLRSAAERCSKKAKKIPQKSTWPVETFPLSARTGASGGESPG